MSESESKRPTLFIIRPWSDARASLYPHTMDGVEYVDAAIDAITRACDDKYDVRFDRDSFIPGRTIRESVEGEIEAADVVLVILDGLRPNVLYEMGFARGLRMLREKEDKERPEIIGIAEKDATVLVRNYYPTPLQAPTTTGAQVTVLNPRLDTCKFFSDNSDALLLIYDRLRLRETLGERLLNILSRLDLEPTTAEAISLSQESDKPPSGEVSGDAVQPAPDLWALYERGAYDSIISRVGTSSSASEKKVLALAFMKSRRISDAIRVWKELAAAGKEENSAAYHLGVCYYALRDYDSALYWVERAHQLETNKERSQRLRERILNKIAWAKK